MRKASILLVGFLVLVLLTFCAKKPPVVEEKPKPPEVTQPEQPPEIPKEGVEGKLVTQKDLQPIYFNFDKYDLRPGDREILNLNAKVLKENPNVKIRIEGNCDERGTVEYNLALGDRRARAAMDYLVNLGVTPGRISIISYGKERCKHCYNEECWSKDRRDDFMIVSQ
ncbi:MAG: OmpA family protein [candidate division Zixibacteria bacterium]|nr:OmpA family protein [candidate division Zixibacteria bacterium]